MGAYPRDTETVGASGADEAGERELLAAGELLAGRWRIVRALGRGGYAVVYLARDERLARDVALKVLRPDRIGGSALRRLRREAALARDLSHPNLIRVFDVEEAGGFVFLTLELASGGSLRELLAGGPLPVERAVAVAAEIFAALAALHAVGIVHRDVKPANVLLGSDGEVKLSDFGLALQLERDETRVTATEATIGTLQYLSPEQAMGEEIDARSDLYSAGLVLFEMLTGRLPYGARSSLGHVIARFRTRPPSVRSLRREVPRWLARVVERLLERRREDRYAGAAAVAADLARRRARLAAPRRRLVVAAGLLALATVAAAAGWAWNVARNRRFSHVEVSNDAKSVVALDGLGRTLWRRDAIRAAWNFVSFRPERGGPLRLAAQLAEAEDYDLQHVRQLSILDPQSGREVSRFELAEASEQFPGFAAEYSVRLHVTDLDGDGADEIVVDFVHSPYWPNFAVLAEPRFRRSRVVFVASGHHWFRGAVDLDGDGRREMIFAGINNRLGWHQAVAAVRAPEGLGQAAGASWVRVPAVSADRLGVNAPSANLLWYELAPRGRVSPDGFEIEPATRTMKVLYDRLPPYAIGFDGLPEASATGSPDEAARRANERQLAYQAMVEGARLEETLENRHALAAYDDGLRHATAARLSVLELWLRQCRLRVRAAVAPWTEVREEMNDLLTRSSNPAEVAFDIGRALHRAGRLPEAIEAYGTSYAQLGATDGRADYEVFEALVLALIESKRFADANLQVDRYCDSVAPGTEFCGYFRTYVRWAEGKRVVVSDIPTSQHQVPDLQRYWNLEFRLAAGVDPARLLTEAEALLGQVSEAGVLLDSFAAELEGRLGRVDDAARRADAAFDRFAGEVRRDFYLRASAPLVRERAAKWARAAAAVAPAPR